MARTGVRLLGALLSLAALAGGLWAVGAGWDLRDVAADAVAAGVAGTPTPAEVVGAQRIGGVAVDVVRFETGGIEVRRRVVAPAHGPQVGDAVHVRVVTSATAARNPALPILATTYVGSATADEVEHARHRAGLLLWGGFTVAVVAAFVSSAALYLLWPEPKKRTAIHIDRAGT